MNTLKKYSIPLFCLLLALLIGTGTVYAWFFNGNRIKEIKFISASVDTEVVLYEAADYDRNGICDMNFDGENYSEILLDRTADNRIAIDDMLPSQTVTYKISVTNTGSSPCNIKMTVSGLSGILKDVLSVQAYSKENASGETITAEKIFLAGNQDVTIIENVPAKPSETSSIYFRIKFETLPALKEKGYFTENTDLNAYKNASFSLSNIIISATSTRAV